MGRKIKRGKEIEEKLSKKIEWAKTKQNKTKNKTQPS
jgi:ribosomal protein S19